MKSINLSAACAALLIAALTACGGGGNPVIYPQPVTSAPVVIQPGALNLKPNTASQVTVSQAGYSGTFTFQPISVRGDADCVAVLGQGPQFTIVAAANCSTTTTKIYDVAGSGEATQFSVTVEAP